MLLRRFGCPANRIVRPWRDRKVPNQCIAVIDRSSLTRLGMLTFVAVVLARTYVLAVLQLSLRARRI